MDTRRLFGLLPGLVAIALAAPALLQAQVATELPSQQLEPHPLTPADDNRRLGSAIVVSGRRILVAAGNTGAVYEFIQDRDGIWQRAEQLAVAGSLPEDRFGASLALQGERALIGAPGKSTVYYFERTRGQWRLRQALQARETAPGFGVHVDLHGSTAAIGSDDVSTSESLPEGSVRIFELSHGRWVQTARLQSRTGSADGFGASLSLFGDRLLVGAPAFNGQGAAVLFERRGRHRWVESMTLLAADGELNDQFGSAVALRRNVAVIGARFADGVQFVGLDGSAYVFWRSGRHWVEMQKLRPPPDSEFGSYGARVELAPGWLAISAPGRQQGVLTTKVFVYERNGRQYDLIALLQKDFSFGESLDISRRTLAVGQPFTLEGAGDPPQLIAPGAAHAFVLPRRGAAAANTGDEDDAED